MAGDNRVRIVVQYQGQRWFFVRLESPNRPLLADFESIGSAAMLPREPAVAICRKLREGGWQATVETPSGVALFQDVLAPAPVESTPERVPMRAGDVLIVPGQPPRNGFYIRFPNTPVESLWSETAEEVYKKLLNHPLSGELIPLAEKFVAPPEPVVDPREIQRSLQFERHGRIRRPDLG